MKRTNISKTIINDSRYIIDLDVIGFQYLIKALEYPEDFDGKKVIEELILKNLKEKRKYTVHETKHNGKTTK